MRNKSDNPPPETTQARPAPRGIFDPCDWVQLTPAFGQLKSIVGPNDLTATCFNWYVHAGQLELVLVARDGTYRRFDSAERQKLTIHAPLNYEEGCRIEPYFEGRWYARRSHLDRLTTIPPPAARAEESMSEPVPLSSQIESELPLGPSQSPQAKRRPQQPPLATQPGEPAIADPAPVASARSPAVLPAANPGGRPTDRDMVLEEAGWRLRHQQTKAESLAAFARELRGWLEDHGEHRTKKTGDVMKTDTIEDHVRTLWNEHR